MTKRRSPLLLLLVLLLPLAACTPTQKTETKDDATQNIVATTYPIYLFLSELTKDAEGITVTPLINQAVSCLHDYTLSVKDMKTLEKASSIFLNGAGLDDFILPAVAQAGDASKNVFVFSMDKLSPLPLTENVHAQEDAHTEQGDAQQLQDPHFWMDPTRAACMVEQLAAELARLDPAQAAHYHSRGEEIVASLHAAGERLGEKLAALSGRQLITFHGGFSYFAEAFDLDLVLAIEEEEGQEASAQLIQTALQYIDEYSLPAIFTEEFSADATAKAIAREADIALASLSLIMSGSVENVGLATYLEALERNVDVILGAYT